MLDHEHIAVTQLGNTLQDQSFGTNFTPENVMTIT